jgi:uncharacterized protein (TIGR02391 family)
MPKLADLIPDPDVLYALEPDELGLRMLPALATWQTENRVSELMLDTFLVTVIGDGHGHNAQYPLRQNATVEEAVREAWAWLEGAALLIKHRGYREPNHVRSLSRRARQLAEEPDARKVFSARRIPKETLDPSIREEVWSLYHRGKYDTAVFEAMKAVEVAVREVSGMPAAALGVKLMREAFAPSPNAGPLTDLDVDRGEQVARMEFFAGAIGSYKNPHSHRNVALDDPDEAAEIIMVANHLLRIIESRRAVAGGA